MMLLVGLGGLGSLLAYYLRVLYKKWFVVLDKDIVDESNIKYHPFYNKKDLGEYKAKIVGNRLGLPYIISDIKDIDLSPYKIVIEALDNWRDRKYLIKKSKELGFILIHTAVSEDKGELAIIKESHDYFLKFEGEGHARNYMPLIFSPIAAWFIDNYYQYFDKFVIFKDWEITILNAKRVPNFKHNSNDSFGD